MAQNAKKLIKLGLLTSAILTSGSFTGFAQTNLWQSSNIDLSNSQFKVSKGKAFVINENDLLAVLQKSGNTLQNAVDISIPNPDGEMQTFHVWKNDLLPTELANKFTNIHTYSAISNQDNAITAKIDITPLGMHIMVLGKEQNYYINPFQNGVANNYIAFYKDDYLVNSTASAHHCDFSTETLTPTGSSVDIRGKDTYKSTFNSNGKFKRYRLALACTPQYAIAVAGTSPSKEDVLAAMVTSMNRVNGIYEKELGVTMQMIANEDTIIFNNTSFTSYTNNDGEAMLSQNQTIIDNYIGSANYDIGHVFSTGGGGIAYLGSTCGTYKAGGVTGSEDPVGDPFDVDYVCHEMGHQFGADHNFNRCTGTENESTAYEPGSGSSIMGYAGICSYYDNIQEHSDALFDFISLQEITDFLNANYSNYGGGSCGVVISSGNSAPTITAVADSSYTIPYNTPFELTGNTATAAANGTLTYSWEQSDLGNYQQTDYNASTFTAGPIFKSVPYITSTTRVFPTINNLVNGTYSTTGYHLPKVARNLSFYNIVKETHSDGWGTFTINNYKTRLTVINTGDSFRVSDPSSLTLSANTSTTVSWNVASTNTAPISTDSVQIFLSIDSGYTYPFVLSDGTPNTGTATVTLPDVSSSKVRLKVKGKGNVFFDINPTNFSVTGGSITGTNNIANSNSLNIYPNPTNNELNISLNGNTSKASVSIYNTLGQLLLVKTFSKSSIINTSGMANGIYFVHIMTDDGNTYTQRVSVQH